jgi:hypothetical protein
LGSVEGRTTHMVVFGVEQRKRTSACRSQNPAVLAGCWWHPYYDFNSITGLSTMASGSRTYDLEKVGFVCIVLVARCAANDGSAAACRNLSFVLKSGPSRLPSR